MALQKRSKTISSITRTLLSEGENETVDFKRSPEGIHAEDFVSFANSEAGGQLLIGVDEQTVENAQIGIIRGCDVTDATILSILNKAVSCIPPVSIDIFTENLSTQPILRIVVPSSTTKPHCTPKGIYCRRDGSRNRPLQPTELLKIFLDAEARAFAERFESAAGRIADDLTNLESSLDKSIQSMADQLGWAEYQLGDTESTLNSILGSVHTLNSATGDVSARLRSLFLQDKREDPIRKREFKKLVAEVVKAIDSRDDLLARVKSGENLSVTADANLSPDLTSNDLKMALEEAVRHVYQREEKKKYQVFCTPSEKLTAEQKHRLNILISNESSPSESSMSLIDKSRVIGCITYEGVIVGTAMLRKPRLTYRTKIFTQFGSEADPKEYPFELHDLYLESRHRKMGQMTKLLKELLPLAKNSGIFAVPRVTDELSFEVLPQRGFHAFASTDPHDERSSRLFLYTAE